MPYLKFQSNSFEDQNRSHSSGLTSTSQVISSKLLHSWVYPQSTLPPSLIQVLTSSTAEGGAPNIYIFLQTVLIFPLSLFSWNCLIISSFTFTFAAEMEFLRKRQVAWEDSFQSLYYMLRNGTCNIFYGNYLCPYIVFFQATLCVFIYFELS